MIKVFLTRYETKEQLDITDYISGNLPESDDSDINTLTKFNITLQELTAQGDLLEELEIDTGDDLMICEFSDSGEYLGIKYQKLDGKISSLEGTPYPRQKYFDDGKANKFTYKVTVEQRDFSIKPFEINLEGSVMAKDLITKVVEQWVRSDLGGIFTSGTIVPKVTYFFEDFEIYNYQKKATAKKHLDEICNRSELNWELLSLSEDNDGEIERIYTLNIWQE